LWITEKPADNDVVLESRYGRPQTKGRCLPCEASITSILSGTSLFACAPVPQGAARTRSDSSFINWVLTGKLKKKRTPVTAEIAGEKMVPPNGSELSHQGGNPIPENPTESVEKIGSKNNAARGAASGALCASRSRRKHTRRKLDPRRSARRRAEIRQRSDCSRLGSSLDTRKRRCYDSPRRVSSRVFRARKKEPSVTRTYFKPHKKRRQRTHMDPQAHLRVAVVDHPAPSPQGPQRPRSRWPR